MSSPRFNAAEYYATKAPLNNYHVLTAPMQKSSPTNTPTPLPHQDIASHHQSPYKFLPLTSPTTKPHQQNVFLELTAPIHHSKANNNNNNNTTTPQPQNSYSNHNQPLYIHTPLVLTPPLKPVATTHKDHGYILGPLIEEALVSKNVVGDDVIEIIIESETGALELELELQALSGRGELDMAMGVDRRGRQGKTGRGVFC